MLKKIQQYLTSHRLPLPPAPLVVALSGGADSVALTLILRELGYGLTALHCNFHLRGEESNRDEVFVRDFCDRLHLPLIVKDFDTTGYAETHHISIEMAARELRYAWFEEMRQQRGAAAIAVAHHIDDNAETLLLNLVRGSGIRGLKGMLPQQGHIIRPLLCVRRGELENYLSMHGQCYVTDSTNLETIYKRNKIRHKVLPLLRELNPSIEESLAQTANRLAEAEILYRDAVQHLKKELCENLPDGILLHLEPLLQHPAAATLLHEFLLPYGFSPAEISMISQQLRRPTGTLFTSRTHIAALHRGNLEVRKKPADFPATPLTNSGQLALPDGGFMHIDRMQREELKAIPKQSDRVALDAATLTGDLFLRRLREGDRFQPYGMKGTQLVSDYLTNHHRSVIDKQKALVLCDTKGIVWLVGERVAQRVAITDTCKQVLLLTLAT